MMKMLLYTITFLVAAITRTTSMAIDFGDQYCIDFPYADDKAISACQWILDVDSPFRKCMSAFDTDRVKEFYSMCQEIFCDKGDDGACQFADNLADICNEKYDIGINGRPDFCAAITTTTPESYCTEAPGKDENAIEACSWLLDVDSPFHDCMDKLKLSKTKQIYQTCLNIFCEKGQEGICDYVDNVVGVCNENGVNVDGKPDFCGTVIPPSCDSDTATQVCSWILDIGTSFHDCLSSFGPDKIKAVYNNCVKIFCDQGESGVCEDANNLAGVCEEHCMMKIMFRPSFCQPVVNVDVGSYCDGSSSVDDNAKNACSFLLDQNGAFNLCDHMLGIDADSEQYQACLDTYCHHGNEGVCRYAATIAGTCESSFGFPVGGSLPFC